MNAFVLDHKSDLGEPGDRFKHKTLCPLSKAEINTFLLIMITQTRAEPRLRQGKEARNTLSWKGPIRIIESQLLALGNMGKVPKVF